MSKNQRITSIFSNNFATKALSKKSFKNERNYHNQSASL